MIHQKASKKANVFAAFTPPDMAQILTINGLGSAARKLYLYVHTIAPFGNWYCWNDSVNERTVRQVLQVKSANPNSIRRTYERARKELAEKKFVAFSSRGFRILCLMNRPVQPLPLEEAFFDGRSRQNDRDRPSKPLPAERSGVGKDQSNLDLKETNTQQSKKSVCSTNSFSKKKSVQDKSIPRSSLPRPVLKPKLKEPKAAKREKITRAAAFTKLDEKYLIELDKLGIPRGRINGNLVNAIHQHSWQNFKDSADYLKRRIERKDLPPIPNPVGYLIDGMRSGYRLADVSTAETTKPVTEVAQWLDLAYNALRLCSSFRDRDGELMIVFRDWSYPITFAEAKERYPLDTLRGMMDGQLPATFGGIVVESQPDLDDGVPVLMTGAAEPEGGQSDRVEDAPMFVMPPLNFLKSL